MNWSSWADFFYMGGKGFFVWGALGFALVVILLEMLQLWLRRRRFFADSDAGPEILHETKK